MAGWIEEEIYKRIPGDFIKTTCGVKVN